MIYKVEKSDIFITQLANYVYNNLKKIVETFVNRERCVDSTCNITQIYM